MTPLRDHFVKMYKLLYNIIKEGDVENAKALRINVGDEMLSQLSNLCLSFIQEGLASPAIDRSRLKEMEVDWQQLLDICIKLSESNIETRNRFRRIIPISRIMEMAEMINAIKTDEGYFLLKEKFDIFTK